MPAIARMARSYKVACRVVGVMSNEKARRDTGHFQFLGWRGAQRYLSCPAPSSMGIATLHPS